MGVRDFFGLDLKLFAKNKKKTWFLHTHKNSRLNKIKKHPFVDIIK